jgi:hypothetical protein
VLLALRRALRIDVDAEIASVEPQVLPDLDDGKAIARAGPRVLIDPGQGDVQVAGRLVYGEEVVLHDVTVVIVQTDIRGHGGGCGLHRLHSECARLEERRLGRAARSVARGARGAGPASCSRNKPATAGGHDQGTIGPRQVAVLLGCAPIAHRRTAKHRLPFYVEGALLMLRARGATRAGGSTLGHVEG